MYYTKITHRLLSKVENIFLRNILLILFYISKMHKETNRLALYTCVRHSILL